MSLDIGLYIECSGIIKNELLCNEEKLCNSKCVYTLGCILSEVGSGRMNCCVMKRSCVAVSEFTHWVVY